MTGRVPYVDSPAGETRLKGITIHHYLKTCLTWQCRHLMKGPSPGGGSEWSQLTSHEDGGPFLTLKDWKIQASDGQVVKYSRRGTWQRGRNEHAICGSETSLTGMENRKFECYVQVFDVDCIRFLRGE